MATNTTATVSNTYQKYFSKKLLDTQEQETVLDQFAYKETNLPKEVGAKIVSFFTRSNSANNSSGQVAAVQTLSEGTPIASFTNFDFARIDVTMVQYGEAAKFTDIGTMTQLFNIMENNIAGMGEDAALHNDNVSRDALVAATGAGVTLVGASGNTTGTMSKMYGQSITSFANLNTASVSAGKLTMTDFIRASTQLYINRAPMWGGAYVGIVCGEIAFDIQNDPDWIDAHNYSGDTARFRSELGKFGNVRFVQQTNPFKEDGTGSEGTYSIAASAANRIFRAFVLGKQAFGTPKISGDSTMAPKVMIVPPNRPEKSDPLGQFGTAGWKNYWAATGLRTPFGISLSGKSEFVGA